jgi:hypothetical protein
MFGGRGGQLILARFPIADKKELCDGGERLFEYAHLENLGIEGEKERPVRREKKKNRDTWPRQKA